MRLHSFPTRRSSDLSLEMTLGAVVAGPFDITEGDLSGLIERAMAADRETVQSRTIH